MGFATVGRVIVIIINIVFLVLGVVFFGGGLFLRFGSDLLTSFYEPVLQALESQLETNGFGVISIEDFDFRGMMKGLSIGFICFGLFLLIITIFGCCGACYKIKFMLVVYATIVIVILVGEIIFAGILFGKPDLIKDDIKSALKSGIQNNYAGFNGTNVESLGWNFAHRQWECCGVDSYQDFTGATNWLTNYGTGGTLKAPITCCITIPQSSSLTCATTPTNHFTKGCFDEVYNMLLGNVALVAGCIAGCAVCQLLLIIFAFMVFADARKNKVDPNTNSKKNKNRYK